PNPSRSQVISREASPPPIRPTTIQTIICAADGMVISSLLRPVYSGLIQAAFMIRGGRFSSLEVAVEKLVQAVVCIFRCLAVVFQPVLEHRPTGLEVRVIKSMVRAGIDDQLDWRPVIAPAGDLLGALGRRCPIVEGANEDERGYPRTRNGLHAWGIERSCRAE